MLNKEKASTPGLGQVFSQGFSLGLGNDNRSSVLFGSSTLNSESTVGDSMCSGSILGSVGKGSIVDFNISGLLGRRTSIA